MKTAVIGYPRIGLKRELKFAIEKYLKGQIEQSELITKAKALRKINWLDQDNQKSILFHQTIFHSMIMF